MDPKWRGLWWTLVIVAVVGVDGELDAGQTLLWGAGLTVARAGELSTFHLQTRNSAGDNVSTDASSILVQCVSDAPATEDFCSGDPTVIDEGGGAFRVEFVVGRFWAAELDPWTEGIYPNPLPEDFFSQTSDRLRVKVDGSPVAGSPFSPLLLGENAIDPENCLVSSSIQFLRAGVSAGVGEWLELRDRFGNAIRPVDVLDATDPRLTLIETMPWSSTGNEEAELRASWILTNWYIDFQATCYTAGRYRFEALYGEVDPSPLPIEHTPTGVIASSVTLDCVPGALRRVELTVDGNIELGSVVTLFAQAYDSYGNAAYYGDAVLDGVLASPDAQSLDDVEVEILHSSCDCSLLTALNVALQSDWPGRLRIDFVTETPGIHGVRVRYGGVDYVEDPFELTIGEEDASQAPRSSEATSSTPNPLEAPETIREVDVSKSIVDAGSIAPDGQISLKAGDLEYIFVSLLDDQNEAVEGEVADLAVWLINRVNPMQGLMQLTRYPTSDTSIGHYTVEIRAELATLYDLLVTYKGLPIEHGITTVVVQPSDEISPANTIISGSAIGVELGQELYYVAEDFRQIAGRNMSLILTAVDPYGNIQRTTKPGFELNRIIQSAATWFQVFEFGDGQTRFYFAIETTGFYELRATLGENTVYASRLEIGPEVVSHSNSRVFGVSSIVAGENGEGFLQVQDLYANVYDTVYQSLINLTQFHISFQLEHSERSIPVVYTGFSDEQAAVTFRYNLTQSGSYIVKALWEFWPMQGDGASIEVLPAEISFDQTHAAALESTISAGESAVVQIVARDRFGNLLGQDASLGERTELRIVRFADGLPLNRSFEIDEMSVGVIEATVRLTVAELYLIEAEIDERRVSIGDPKLTVVASELSDASSGIEYSEDVAVGEWHDVVLLPRDLFGNAVVEGQNFTLRIRDASLTVQDFAKSEIYGQLIARYRISTPGNYSIDVVQGGAVFRRFQVSARSTDSSVESATGRHIDPWMILVFVASAVLILFAYWILSKEDVESEDDASDTDTLEIHSDFVDRADSAKELIENTDGDAEMPIKAYRPENPN